MDRKVVFIKLNKIYGAIIMRDGQVINDGLPEIFWQDIERNGVTSPTGILYPRDGERFMEYLPFAFTGAIIRAKKE